MKVVQGDITTLEVDAIVNAANQVMLGGGGVDGAIHRAAGRELYDACQQVPEARPGVRCPTGEARITPGFKLPAKFVIHTVVPVYRDGQHGEPEKLANCYLHARLLRGAHPPLLRGTFRIRARAGSGPGRECASARPLRAGGRGRHPQRNHLRFQDALRLALLEDREVADGNVAARLDA